MMCIEEFKVANSGCTLYGWCRLFIVQTESGLGSDTFLELVVERGTLLIFVDPFNPHFPIRSVQKRFDALACSLIMEGQGDEGQAEKEIVQYEHEQS